MYAVVDVILSEKKELIPLKYAEYSAKMYLAASQSVAQNGLSVLIR